ASADMTWFPWLATAAATTGAGGTVSGYVIRTAQETVGPAANPPATFGLNTLITNDPATFTEPNFHTIRLAHGGFIRADVTMTFGTNAVGDPCYFQVDIPLLD